MGDLHAAGLACALVLVAGSVAAPTVSAAGPKGGYCENVRFAITQDMPEEDGMAVTQSFYLDANCRVVVTPSRTVEASSLEAAPADSQSAILGSESGQLSTVSGPVTLAATSYVGYASTRVYDCCGIMLTEHWNQTRWTSSNPGTGVITAWSATHGAKWHDEAGPVPGWYLDPNVSSLGLVEGGLNQSYVRTKGRQGFKYQGVFDPTGTLFYNDLSDWVRGSRSGALSCTHAYDLRRVPAGPLAWPAPSVACVRGAYPNP